METPPMARRPAKTLTELELEIMHAVWDEAAPIDVEGIRARLQAKGRAYAPATVRTMLGILLDKGFVTREKAGRGFRYEAAVAREAAQAGMLADLVQRAFDGSAAGLAAALLGTGKVSKRELERIKRLIAEREKEGGP